MPYAEAALENYEDADEARHRDCGNLKWSTPKGVVSIRGVLALHFFALKIDRPGNEDPIPGNSESAIPGRQVRAAQALNPLTVAYRQAGNFAKMAEMMALIA